jgi:hypothetical protein
MVQLVIERRVPCHRVPAVVARHAGTETACDIGIGVLVVVGVAQPARQRQPVGQLVTAMGIKGIATGFLVNIEIARGVEIDIVGLVGLAGFMKEIAARHKVEPTIFAAQRAFRRILPGVAGFGIFGKADGGIIVIQTAVIGAVPNR